MKERLQFLAKAKKRLAKKNPDWDKTAINKAACEEWKSCPLRVNIIRSMSEAERKKRRFEL